MLKVAIVEDEPQTREGLAALIGASEGLRCTGAYGSMEEALPAVALQPPDIALLDIGLPGLSGIEGIPLLKQRCPQILILMLTVYSDDERIFAALCAGALGYLLKQTPPDRLLAGLREVASGGAPMTPEVARRVVELFGRVRPPAQAEYDLTPHERRVLGLLVAGHNYKSAALQLGVTVHAVSFHMRRIYGKLQVHSKSEAVSKALRHRLVP